MHRRFSNNSGYTLIEISIAIFGVLTLLLVVFDVARVVQTHSAVKESADLAARHLTLLKGGAQQLSESTQVPEYRWSMVSFGSGSAAGKRITRSLGTTTGDGKPTACGSPPPGSYCERTFVGYRGGAPSASRFNSEAAFQYIEKELNSVLPRVRRGCVNEAHCISVATDPVDLRSAPVEGGISVTVRYMLPLIILGNRSIQLTATSRRAVEVDFAETDVAVETTF